MRVHISSEGATITSMSLITWKLSFASVQGCVLSSFHTDRLESVCRGQKTDAGFTILLHKVGQFFPDRVCRVINGVGTWKWPIGS